LKGLFCQHSRSLGNNARVIEDDNYGSSPLSSLNGFQQLDLAFFVDNSFNGSHI
jgi:hypothetical protein